MATLLIGPELDAACAHFLFQEAYLLDHRRYTDWLALLTADVEYAIPLRFATVDGRDEYSRHSYYMKETFDSIEARIARFATDYAWAEEPPSKTRHCVSNVFIEDGVVGRRARTQQSGGAAIHHESGGAGHRQRRAHRHASANGRWT